jgi:hypothetical protein
VALWSGSERVWARELPAFRGRERLTRRVGGLCRGPVVWGSRVFVGWRFVVWFGVRSQESGVRRLFDNSVQ